ncbi:hypothetical protein M2322_004622 [Rhodoblastus acidophilus]|uniref:gas vesicle protein K n=1 Tax=Rhodoblastus acidophilus TaxID=1074 RepID=UPI0022252CD9|nr:gas vesicle protein K [Rhodoblastus acidophilus]MCW2319053.1 hypothetical protein [Rhodoblastus acidophilus]
MSAPRFASLDLLVEPPEGAPVAALNLDPDQVERDLSRLVLGLVEFLRQLMEAQAIRRMEAGRLTPEEEEALGLTLMRAHEKILDLAEKFGLKPEDLRLDLGPLGRLT